jgi:hypothetical protein
MEDQRQANMIEGKQTVMFRQLLKRVVSANAQTRARFDMGIRLLFYMTCANVLVLFFIQGGY